MKSSGSECGETPAAIVPSFDEALKLLSTEELSSKVATIFVIGGGQVYREAVLHGNCAAVHMTEIQSDLTCDTFFPKLPEGRFQLWGRTQLQQTGKHQISFKCYVRWAQP
jgi:dihydrofolate reductase / thymidylate synthase